MAAPDEPSSGEIIIGRPVHASTQCGVCYSTAKVMRITLEDRDYRSNTVHLCGRCRGVLRKKLGEHR